MVLGRFEIVRIGGLTIGRATYQPGWKWSIHVGLVVSGEATAAFEDGTVIPLRDGELFYIPPMPHDSWVVGDLHSSGGTWIHRNTPIAQPT
jgi:hypothetical protein